jgi:hypothetical protein
MQAVSAFVAYLLFDGILSRQLGHWLCWQQQTSQATTTRTAGTAATA